MASKVNQFYITYQTNQLLPLLPIQHGIHIAVVASQLLLLHITGGTNNDIIRIYIRTIQTLQNMVHDPLKSCRAILNPHMHNTPLVSLTRQIHGALSSGLGVKGNLMTPFTQVPNSDDLMFALILSTYVP